APPSVSLVGQVFDRNGAVIAHEPLSFTLGSTSTGDALTPNAVGDTVRLRVASGLAGDRDVQVTLTHAPSALSLVVPVRLHMAPDLRNGVAVPRRDDPWPMVGMASGAEGPAWMHNQMRAFVRRVGLGAFEGDGATLPPVGDEPSGTVLSPNYALWRKANPWTGSAVDVVVPTGVEAQPPVLSITPFFAATDPTHSSLQLTLDLEGGADIVERTLVGATVSLAPVVELGVKITWSAYCADLGTALAALPPAQQPGVSRLAVYMVARAGTPGGDLPYHCPPGTLGTTGTLAKADAIFLPEGPVPPASVAHEVGHALSLTHVTLWSGFLDNNLMVETFPASAVLRNRFSVGQAFRAALDPRSWLVRAGVAPSAPIDCATTPAKCPLQHADVTARIPP
ncbi:MAG TPA: hypothetical protein VFV33_14010, partial [Gemmatimonadaceae bacterium]|nr:hypothetical protein [Gemmatimonadaceae bacterium]